MSLGPYITRQPVLNRQRAITANRLLVHARGDAPSRAAAAALNALAEVWPSERSVFVSLGGITPDAGLLDWHPPENAMLEIPAGALNSATASQLIQGFAELGVPLCLDGGVPARSLPAGVHFNFSLADAAGGIRPDALPGVPLARDPGDIPAFEAALQAGFAGASGWFSLKTRPSARKPNGSKPSRWRACEQPAATHRPIAAREAASGPVPAQLAQTVRSEAQPSGVRKCRMHSIWR